MSNSSGATALSIVQECVEVYDVRHRTDGGITITIEVPRRFAELWLVKLSGLRATQSEICEYEPDDEQRLDK